ncbi:hypothetical protein METBIDRAFT_96032 [Metschnikowia bicuspidata var. bicuspidata NRRL YB-4993]|uniref:Uncharacterized protein n=1 Tax=Metschnikowia bicuspidata var. bicuspidata NRRL YB-4993 TaxID=869754 RepID=A0A1A0HG69_9ASCO|nr:hypothetical protein METBIDRAFT_96032 [Metschnikowia bicuspidata var. bicuspidata NRRL YB-4993]OBA22985.1 hypothetical protein METBIDRAFT_96032 [Metschnikowia bicuspidata var. bicuspidata NRRL YB-4993]
MLVLDFLHQRNFFLHQRNPFLRLLTHLRAPWITLPICVCLDLHLACSLDSYLFAAALSILLYLPSKGIRRAWSRTSPTGRRPMMYNLSRVDFLSRSAFAAFLAPQIRHNPRFNEFAL